MLEIKFLMEKFVLCNQSPTQSTSPDESVSKRDHRGVPTLGSRKPHFESFKLKSSKLARSSKSNLQAQGPKSCFVLFRFFGLSSVAHTQAQKPPETDCLGNPKRYTGSGGNLCMMVCPETSTDQKTLHDRQKKDVTDSIFLLNWHEIFFVNLIL